MGGDDRDGESAAQLLREATDLSQRQDVAHLHKDAEDLPREARVSRARVHHQAPPSGVSLVLDSWSSGGHHYIAIFAVFHDPTAAETGAKQRGAEYYSDVDCDTRRFVLLALRPVEDEEDLRAQSLFDLIAETLSLYNEMRSHTSGNSRNTWSKRCRTPDSSATFSTAFY